MGWAAAPSRPPDFCMPVHLFYGIRAIAREENWPRLGLGFGLGLVLGLLGQFSSMALVLEPYFTRKYLFCNSSLYILQLFVIIMIIDVDVELCIFLM